ncbi:MAG: M48 family metallopeptidase [Victivallaceae bacterium]
MTDEVEYGQYRIAYSVEFCERKTLEIAVMPDGSVCLKAPRNTALEKLRSRVLRRAGWILKQQRYFAQFRVKTPPRQYLGGETHLYLGRQYRLRLVSSEEVTVKLNQGYIIVSTPDLSPDAIRKILEQYYRRKAKEKYREYLIRLAEQHKIETLPQMRIRSMKTNWGSMSTKGILSLNPELIKAPVQCLEYVITHELCHLCYREHDKNFYHALSYYLPDWQKRKEKLEFFLI